jgi:hypothetical protein
MPAGEAPVWKMVSFYLHESGTCQVEYAYDLTYFDFVYRDGCVSLSVQQKQTIDDVVSGEFQLPLEEEQRERVVGPAEFSMRHHSYEPLPVTAFTQLLHFLSPKMATNQAQLSKLHFTVNFHGSNSEFDAAVDAVVNHLAPYSNLLNDLSIEYLPLAEVAHLNQLVSSLARCQFTGKIAFSDMASEKSTLAGLSTSTINQLCVQAECVKHYAKGHIATTFQCAEFNPKTLIKLQFRADSERECPYPGADEDEYYQDIDHIVRTNNRLFKLELDEFGCPPGRILPILEAVASPNNHLEFFQVTIKKMVNPPSNPEAFESECTRWNNLWGTKYSLKSVSFRAYDFRAFNERAMPNPRIPIVNGNFYCKTVLIYAKLNSSGRENVAAILDLLSTLDKVMHGMDHVTDNHDSEDLTCAYLLLRKNPALLAGDRRTNA